MKLPSTSPFQDFTAYLNFHKRMGRWQVCLVGGGRRKTILYSKYLMGVSIGRELTKDQEVDHVDGDKTNDSIDNLEIVSREENTKRDISRRSRAMVSLICPSCKKAFSREKRLTHIGTITRPITTCSRKCGQTKPK
jgi:HNH endonuclease